MCVCLAGCGEAESSSEGPAAGGAVTKVTSEADTEAEVKTEAADTGEEASEAAETEANEEESELSQEYAGSFTEAFANKLEQRNFTLDTTYYLTYGGEGMDASYSEFLEVKGSEYHFVHTFGDGVNDYYHLDEGDYRADSESSTVQPVTAANVLEAGAANYVFAFDTEGSSFVSAESYSDGTVQETLENEDRTILLTYDGETGVLISIEEDTVIPGDNEATGLLVVNSFEDSCGELSLPSDYEELVP